MSWEKLRMKKFTKKKEAWAFSLKNQDKLIFYNLCINTRCDLGFRSKLSTYFMNFLYLPKLYRCLKCINVSVCRAHCSKNRWPMGPKSSGVATANRKTLRWKATRWTDDLVKVAGIRWMQDARDQSMWRHLGEAFVQLWTSFGCNDDDVSEAKG